MFKPRRLTYPAGVMMLMLAAVGCADYHAVGTISYVTGDDREVHISNPPMEGCHSLGREGAKEVRNETTSDMLMYLRDDCREQKGADTVYIPTLSSGSAVLSEGLWHSFAFVGR